MVAQASLVPCKKWFRSKTIHFFSAIALAGGLDLVMNFLNGEMSWRALAILLISLVGIGLRIVTRHELI